MEENTTVVVEENATAESENFLAGLASGFQDIVDLILKIVNAFKEVIGSIVGSAKG